MKVLSLCILAFFLFCNNSHALDCERAFLNPPVYRMCKTEADMIQTETEKIKVMKDNFAKLLLDDAEKAGKNKEMASALASVNKSPSEEYLINSFINKNKLILDDINYREWKLKASVDEIELIMENFYSIAISKK